MLNKSWVAIDTCTTASAFSRLFAETAKFLDSTDFSLHGLESWLDLPVDPQARAIRTARLSIMVPEVIVLRSDTTPRRRVMQFSRRNLMRRDRGTCQYCGLQATSDKLTVDHVLPRRRGGKSCWANCVLSCVGCNGKKADRTPAEAGMELRPRPEMRQLFPANRARWHELYEPSWSAVFKVNHDKIKESWKRFLPEKVVHG
jgi:5-methylcytosine-specific restriction endonuclease McrA